MSKKPQIYGFWTFGGRNGLEGSANTVRKLPDGSLQNVPDPDFPAVLPDEHIVYALQHSPPARDQLVKLFPSLDPRSQKRITDLLEYNKSVMRLIRSDQDFLDVLQRKDVKRTVPSPNSLSYKG
jgi:hypothetical protein